MWQPEPPERQHSGAGSAGVQASPGRRRRRSGKVLASWLLLALGLGGLGVSAVGIAHQLLPRRFTPAQRRSIAAWEVQRRWRALPAGTIFPASVPYQIRIDPLDVRSDVNLTAERLRISQQSACAAAVTGRAVTVLQAHGCSAAMRATYVDASGGLVATVVVAVLPGASAAHAAATEIKLAQRHGQFLVRPLAVAGTPADLFRDAQRQVVTAAATGPYVVMATAGFSDGRRAVKIADDRYLSTELTSLDRGLAESARQILGHPPPTPRCPGAPGC